MNQPLQEPVSGPTETFLSGAYERILRITLVLAIVAVAGGSLWMGWRSGLVLLAGAAAGYVNFVWLHRAVNVMTDRILASGQKPSRVRLLIAFGGRYIFVIAVACVIFKGYPRMVVGFMVTLVLPVIAAVCEGVYELFAQGGSGPAQSN